MPQELLEDTSARGVSCPPAIESRRIQVYRVSQSREQNRNYLAYMLPTTMVIPMIGYGTRLEPVLTIAMILGWGIYAAICSVRNRQNRGLV